MKSEGEDGHGYGTPFPNQHQVSQDRPSTGIPRVREREGDQGTVDCGLSFAAYASGGVMGLDR